MKAWISGAALAALSLPASVLGAGAVVTVTHDLEAARPRATIAVPFKELAKVDPGLRMYHVVVRDAEGRVLPSQITNYQHDHKGVDYDDLVFAYDFRAGEKRAVFTVEPSAAPTPPEPPCAYARTVPERYDDMAWENDRIAHRMYGPGLNTEAAGGSRLRGSGIDIWGKRVPYPIIDRWYAKGHDQFHKDEEGEGYDIYSIGTSRGAGGSGLWDGSRLWTSDNYARAEVLSNGPRRVAFRLHYAPWEAGSAGSVAETKQFTVDCGRNFSTVDSVFDLAGMDAVVGIGITEHPPAPGFPKSVLTKDPAGRWMSFWEENKDGALGIAVILGADATPAGFAYEAPAKTPGNGNNLLLVKVKDGVPVRYFTGAAWSGSKQFADRAAWEAHVKAHAERAAKPLRIAVSARP
jgi:hypothetical protein